MGQAYLIDSNSIIYYLSNQFPESGKKLMDALVDARPNVSVITKIEVLGFNANSQDAVLLNAFLKDAVVFDLSPEIVDQTIELRKSYRIKIPDAIIAATALVNGMTLITRNTDDFKMVAGLQLTNPFLL